MLLVEGIWVGIVPLQHSFHFCGRPYDEPARAPGLPAPGLPSMALLCCLAAGDAAQSWLDDQKCGRAKAAEGTAVLELLGECAGGQL